MPVGSVITWPSDNLPDWMTHGDYLECNGQNFDIAKYPKLYKALGSNHVPNYQGLFLRGYGSQTLSYYTLNPISRLHYRSQKYSSLGLGKIQFDATRVYENYVHLTMNEHDWNNSDFGPTYKFPGTSTWRMLHSSIDESTSAYDTNNLTENRLFVMTQPPKKYSISGSAESGYSFAEEDDMSAGHYETFRSTEIGAAPTFIFPTADGSDSSSVEYPNEARPINTAVRYFIKAR